MRDVRPGDCVVVVRLDRLARSVRDLLNVLHRFGKDGVGFKSLRESPVDTTSPQGRLVVNILASISEFERELIHARMTEGRKRARKNGVKFGPKFKLTRFNRNKRWSGSRRARARAPTTSAVSSHFWHPKVPGGSPAIPFMSMAARSSEVCRSQPFSNDHKRCPGGGYALRGSELSSM
jgi:hypothetical protein